jgi:cysteine-rich repeat protein
MKQELHMRATSMLAIAGFGLAGYFDEVSAQQADSESGPQRGAPVTTAVDGARVADNTHGARTEVYLAGNPDEHAAAPPAGDYYFAVTDRSGTHVLSSDDISCREIRIGGDGAIVEVYRGASGCAHARGVDHHRAERAALTVQLMPFDVAPDPNGEYSAWVIPVADYDGSFVHASATHDKFKVKTTPPQVCGNGTVEAGEQCDDGNTADGDGCSASCTIETAPLPECGNGIVEPGEQCDDGNTTRGDGCSASCTTEVLPLDCGDEAVGDGEQCDDGDPVTGGGCSICSLDSARKHRGR